MMGVSSCCCLGDCSSGDRKKHVYLLIKGYHCFVYEDEHGESPRYAIELVHRRAVLVPTNHDMHFVPRVPHPGANVETKYATINLESGLGDVEYRITLVSDHRADAAADEDAPSSSPATRFVDAVNRASSAASAVEARTRLGHGGLLNRRASVKFALEIGNVKARDQPDAPISASEIMAGMPVTPTGYG